MKKKKANFNFFKYLKKHIPLIVLNIVLSIAVYVAVFFTSIYSARALEAVTNGDLHLALNKVLIATLIQVGMGILQYPMDMAYIWATSKIYVEVKHDLTAKLFTISAESYGESGASAFVQRVLNDPEIVFNSIMTMFELGLEVITDIVIFVYIMTFNIYIGLLFIGISLIVIIFDYFRNKWRKKKTKELKEINDKIHSYTNEIVRSNLDIKGLDLEVGLKNATLNMHTNMERKRVDFSAKSNLLNVTRRTFMYVATYLVALLAVFAYENLALPMVAFLYIYQNKNIFWRLGNGINTIQNQYVNFRISYDRIQELFDEAQFPTEKFGDISLEECKGEIDFKGVHFAYKIVDNKPKDYKKRKEKEEKPKEIKYKQVLSDVNFHISGGESVAFVGRSGAGKSTIVSLIPKLYECQDGEVLIDGKDVKTLSKESLRKNISLVNQSPYIFNLSIKENLLLSKKDATDEEILDALTKASLGEFISGLEKGIDTVVGENGIKLSGGQKQRLAIARALLKDSKIIIFDESTSSLDNFAQDEVKSAIESLGGGRTVITVAHRLTTIKNAEKIFFIDDGKIVACGTFRELLDSCEDFSKLFSVENI